MRQENDFRHLARGGVVPLGAAVDLFGKPCQPVWYVLLVRPQAEVAVTAQLEKLGARSCWFPTETGWRFRRGRRRKEKYLRLVAPGYVFLEADRKVAWHRMAELTLGRVRGVVGQGATPLHVRDVARLERIRRTPKLLRAEGIRPGSRVELRTGPLAGFVCDVAAVNRDIAALISPAFGAMRVEADVADLERLA